MSDLTRGRLQAQVARLRALQVLPAPPVLPSPQVKVNPGLLGPASEPNFLAFDSDPFTTTTGLIFFAITASPSLALAGTGSLQMTLTLDGQAINPPLWGPARQHVNLPDLLEGSGYGSMSMSGLFGSLFALAPGTSHTVGFIIDATSGLSFQLEPSFATIQLWD